MSTLKINKVTNAGSATDAPNGFTVGGAAVEQTYTSSATEPSSPATGDLWWDSGNDTLYRYVNGEFKALDISASVYFEWGGDRGLFAGGNVSGYSNIIDYIDITTPGNATDFGDLSVARDQLSGTSDGSRAVFAGGYNSSNSIRNDMDYVATATTGNATDFGDLVNATYVMSVGVAADGTYGVFSGGVSTGVENTIQRITVQTTGNATDHGDLTEIKYRVSACSDATNAVFGGGNSFKNTIEYVAIATAGNGTDFGDLTLGREEGAGLSDSTRGVFIGGQNSSNLGTIDYITIATPGNATDFGDVGTGWLKSIGAFSNGTSGVYGGGIFDVGGSNTTNNIEYITIQTPGNGTDFGDLTSGRYGVAGASGAAS